MTNKTFVTHPQMLHVPEPLRDAILHLGNVLPPAELAPWKGLVSFAELDDDYATYERVGDWIHKNSEFHPSWLTGGAIIDCASLQVQYALESGTLREYSETVLLYLAPSEHENYLYVEDLAEGGATLEVPPSAIEEFMADCPEEISWTLLVESGIRSCEMNKLFWNKWVTAYYEPGEYVSGVDESAEWEAANRRLNVFQDY